jgi:predicted RNA binding protein YcfA (HicA-like mRNA interferase family)
MTRLPIVNFKTMEKVLFRSGFKAVRRKGAHVFYRHPGRDLSRPLIREILREIELTPDRFIQELKRV